MMHFGSNTRSMDLILFDAALNLARTMPEVDRSGPAPAACSRSTNFHDPIKRVSDASSSSAGITKSNRTFSVKSAVLELLLLTLLLLLLLLLLLVLFAAPSCALPPAPSVPLIGGGLPAIGITVTA